jgi:hypothetical protein
MDCTSGACLAHADHVSIGSASASRPSQDVLMLFTSDEMIKSLNAVKHKLKGHKHLACSPPASRWFLASE